MNIDFSKLDGLVPAIIQDAQTSRVLMLGFMNEEAYQNPGNRKVTFTAARKNVCGQKGGEW